MNQRYYKKGITNFSQLFIAMKADYGPNYTETDLPLALV
jgi:hypothetical protein